MIWNIITWIILGALAGWIGSKIMKTDEQQGGFANVVIGIIGAFLGGWLISFAGIDVATGSLTWQSILTAILGSVVLIGILNLIRKGKVR